MKRSRRVALVLSLLVLLAATPVQAAQPTSVSLAGCYYANSGTIAVPAGTALNLTIGWGTDKLWEQGMFLLSVKTVADIDGVPIDHANRYFGLPAYTSGVWVERWTYLAGPLTVGKSITITYQWIFRFPVYANGAWVPSGPQFPPLTCRITGA